MHSSWRSLKALTGNASERWKFRRRRALVDAEKRSESNEKAGLLATNMLAMAA